MHFLGFWLIFQLLFVGASSKETTMTYIVFSKLSNSRICIICIYIPKFTNVNIIMYHFFSISNSHSFFNSIQLSPRRDIDCALLFALFFTCYCFSPLQQHKSTFIVDGDWYNNGGNDLSTSSRECVLHISSPWFRPCVFILRGGQTDLSKPAWE